MSTRARFKLMNQDYKKLKQDQVQGVWAEPDQNNVLKWKACIFGPEDTPWEGGTFFLQLNFTEDYPNKAPEVIFKTKIFHPNIYEDGKICLDILEDKNWSSLYDVQAILQSIQSLLTDPNNKSPANVEASQLYQNDKRKYNRIVRNYVEKSWTYIQF